MTRIRHTIDKSYCPRPYLLHLFCLFKGQDLSFSVPILYLFIVYSFYVLLFPIRSFLYSLKFFSLHHLHNLLLELFHRDSHYEFTQTHCSCSSVDTFINPFFVRSVFLMFTLGISVSTWIRCLAYLRYNTGLNYSMYLRPHYVPLSVCPRCCTSRHIRFVTIHSKSNWRWPLETHKDRSYTVLVYI